MKKKDKKIKISPDIQPVNNTLSVCCFDTLATDEAFLVLVQEIFEEETIDILREYGEVLRGIHNRLISEGNVFINGKFYKQEL